MDRLLLLLPTTTYRTEDFIDAARTLGVDLVCASEEPSTFEAHAPDHLLTLDFTDPDGAATKVAELSARRRRHTAPNCLRISALRSAFPVPGRGAAPALLRR